MCQAQLYGEGIMVIILILQVRKRAQGHTANKSFDTILFLYCHHLFSLFTFLIRSILKECPVSPLSTLSSHYQSQHPHLATSTFKHSNTHSYPSLPLSNYLQERCLSS